jgi:hypothetical protein
MQVSYAIMDDCAEGPHWAMVYGGNTYVLYLILPTLVDNTRRCTLISSGILDVEDTQCPFFAIMLYMLLSANMPHKDLAIALGINPPSEIIVADPNGADEMRGDISPRSNSVDCKSTHLNLQN